jgi:hypothetical protein
MVAKLSAARQTGATCVFRPGFCPAAEIYLSSRAGMLHLQAVLRRPLSSFRSAPLRGVRQRRMRSARSRDVGACTAEPRSDHPPDGRGRAKASRSWRHLGSFKAGNRGARSACHCAPGIACGRRRPPRSRNRFIDLSLGAVTRQERASLASGRTFFECRTQPGNVIPRRPARNGRLD